MNPEKIQEQQIYSLHRYIDDRGIPDRDKIFTEGELIFGKKSCLDSGLIKIWHNQPEVVRKAVEGHLSQCEKCGKKFNPEKVKEEPRQGELSLKDG